MRESPPIMQSVDGNLSLVLERGSPEISFNCYYDRGEASQQRCNWQSYHAMPLSYSQNTLAWWSPAPQLPGEGTVWMGGSFREVIGSQMNTATHIDEVTVWLDVTWKLESPFSNFERMIQTMSAGPLANVPLVGYDRNGLPTPRDFAGTYQTPAGRFVLQQNGHDLTGTIDERMLRGDAGTARDVPVTGGVFADVAVMQWQGEDGGKFLFAKLGPDNNQIYACSQLGSTRILAERAP